MPTTQNKRRSIVVRFDLTDEEKRLLRKAARNFGHKGIRELLKQNGINSLIDARDLDNKVGDYR